MEGEREDPDYAVELEPDVEAEVEDEPEYPEVVQESEVD